MAGKKTTSIRKSLGASLLETGCIVALVLTIAIPSVTSVGRKSECKFLEASLYVQQSWPSKPLSELPAYCGGTASPSN